MGPPTGSQGSATAETALALPAVVLLLTVVLSVGAVVADQVRCLDAARTAARWAARGEPGAAARDAAVAVAPPGARVQIEAADGTVRVTVRSTVRLLLPGRPGLEVQASASAFVEGS